MREPICRLIEYANGTVAPVIVDRPSGCNPCSALATTLAVIGAEQQTGLRVKRVSIGAHIGGDAIDWRTREDVDARLQEDTGGSRRLPPAPCDIVDLHEGTGRLG